jgi:Xaa-Pro aminopeptidase
MDHPGAAPLGAAEILTILKSMNKDIETAPPEELRRRLALLRAELAARRLDGFIVPRADEFQGEYVPASAQRLAWLTGFTGSAGAAVVLADQAALFIDGRYTLQARQEAPADLYAYRHLVEEPPTDWLAATAKGMKIGFDPWLHSESWVERARAALSKAGVELTATEGNPLDAVWPDRPAPPAGRPFAHDIAFAGKSSADKRRDIAARLAGKDIAAAVLTQPDSTAWLLNIRGDDVPCTPVALCFALIDRDGGVRLFIDPARLDDDLRAHLGDGVTALPPADFGPALDALGEAAAKVQVDPAWCAHWIVERLRRAGARLEREEDPCALPKACKNPVELEGARAAHRRDGVALARFLHWLEETAPSGEVSESAAASRLAGLRAEGAHYVGPSFETISGAGPNGAIVHYRVSPAGDRRLEPGELYLVDSGGQYRDGTTDVTRTVAVGTPTAAMRRHFTLVLKGHIALSSAVFPKGVTGSQLDASARMPLWSAGLDYDHGTGHGVGSFLSVHEGPQRISKAANSVALQPGMIISNEPGYYKSGHYGIRLENLIAVREIDAGPEAERPMLGFEPLTLAPFDRRLIDHDLLTVAEIAWIDAYHRRVAQEIAPALPEKNRAWLLAATAAL